MFSEAKPRETLRQLVSLKTSCLSVENVTETAFPIHPTSSNLPKLLKYDTLDGSLSLTLSVCFINKCYIVTFHSRHSFQAGVNVQQAILLCVYV